ncbi:hypothetical protein CSB96_0014 [Pseudomonas aeruginosa]|nr:hypothetical protein CSB96_0014 [Pseudomonas aeruginosa]
MALLRRKMDGCACRKHHGISEAKARELIKAGVAWWIALWRA